jgi:S1-C subfamily serine protease
MIGIREDRRGNIHLGDIIIAIDQEPVTDEDSMLSLLEQHSPGDTIEITTLRDDEIQTYQLDLAAPLAD